MDQAKVTKLMGVLKRTICAYTRGSFWRTSAASTWSHAHAHPDILAPSPTTQSVSMAIGPRRPPSAYLRTPADLLVDLGADERRRKVGLRQYTLNHGRQQPKRHFLRGACQQKCTRQVVHALTIANVLNHARQPATAPTRQARSDGRPPREGRLAQRSDARAIATPRTGLR